MPVSFESTHTTIAELRVGDVFHVLRPDRFATIYRGYGGQFLLVSTSAADYQIGAADHQIGSSHRNSGVFSHAPRYLIVQIRGWDRFTYSWKPEETIHQCRPDMPVWIYHDPFPGIEC